MLCLVNSQDGSSLLWMAGPYVREITLPLILGWEDTNVVKVICDKCCKEHQGKCFFIKHGTDRLDQKIPVNVCRIKELMMPSAYSAIKFED